MLFVFLIFFGCGAGDFFENRVKIFYIIEAAHSSNFVMGICVAGKQKLRFFNFELIYIQSRSNSVTLLEYSVEIRTAYTASFAGIIQRKIIITKMLVDVFCCGSKQISVAFRHHNGGCAYQFIKYGGT